MHLTIFDMNNIVYTGIHGESKAYVVDQIDVSGIKHALRRIVVDGIKSKNSKDGLIACFDSHTDRKDIIPEYKSGRSTNLRSEILLQLELLKEILDDCGVVTLKVDGYEADDLIYSSCRQFDEIADNKVVLSSDKDMGYCFDFKTQIKAASSVGTDITLQSYKNAFAPDIEIPYGGSTIYKLFFGDSSDKLLVFKSELGYKPIDLFNACVKPLTSTYGSNPFVGNTEEYIRKVLEGFANANVFTANDMTQLDKRIRVLYPRMYDKMIPTNVSSYNKALLASYCYYVKEYKLAQFLGFNHPTIDDGIPPLFKKYSTLYHSGAYGFSRNLSTDSPVKDYSGTELRTFDFEFDSI